MKVKFLTSKNRRVYPYRSIMNILFSHSYFYQFDPKQWNNKQPYPPLATIQAAACLREANHQVSLFDTALLDSPDGLNDELESSKAEALVLYDDGFNYLTKMCLTKMREAAFDMIQFGKLHNIPVIVSSSDSTDHYEKYLQRGADAVIIGEGEQTLEQLIQSLNDDRESWNNIPGIAFVLDGKVTKTASRPVMRDLDALPLPAWDLVDIKAYEKIWRDNHGYFSINMATTRGCPFKCNWCAKPIYGNRYNSRSPEHVVKELSYLSSLSSIDHIWMCDDIFGLKPGWVQQFNDLLKEQNLRIPYKIQSRADLLLYEDTIDALCESGLDEVWIGAESGSQKILDAMDKGTKIEQIYEATRLLKSKNVKTCFFLQLGYPGETQQDIQLTKQMLADLMPYDIGVSVSYPLPGTKFYENVKSDLKEKANWTDSDDLDLMFQHEYSRKYYKKLHRHIHKYFRKRQGMEFLKGLFTARSNLSFRTIRSVVLGIFYYTPSLLISHFQLKQLEK